MSVDMCRRCDTERGFDGSCGCTRRLDRANELLAEVPTGAIIVGLQERIAEHLERETAPAGVAKFGIAAPVGYEMQQPPAAELADIYRALAAHEGRPVPACSCDEALALQRMLVRIHGIADRWLRTVDRKSAVAAMIDVALVLGLDERGDAKPP